MGSRVTKQLCSCPVMTGNVPTENIQNRTWCSVSWLAYSTLPSDKQADTQGITWWHVSSEARGWVNAPVFLHSSEMTHRDNFSPSSCLEVWAVTVTVLQSTHVQPALQSTGKKLKCQENRQTTLQWRKKNSDSYLYEGFCWGCTRRQDEPQLIRNPWIDINKHFSPSLWGFLNKT